MTVPKPYSAASQKLARAATHIEALVAAIESHFQSDWYSCEFGRNDIGQYSLKVKVRGSPRDFGLIVGDAIHNMRTVLDLLAVDAVALNEGNTKNVYFPFSDGPGTIEEMIKKRNFHRASNADQDRVRALRPYIGGNQLLRSLHDLDIQDKHHTLIPHASLITSPKVSVKTDMLGNPVGFAEGKLELEVDPEEPPKVAFTFPEDSVLSGREILTVLRELHLLVSEIVSSFAKGAHDKSNSV